MNITETRRKAWETRRKKYGSQGHGGSYSRGQVDTGRMRTMETALIRLHAEGVLSEGQAVKMTGLDRVSVRERVDDMAQKVQK